MDDDWGYRGNPHGLETSRLFLGSIEFNIFLVIFWLEAWMRDRSFLAMSFFLRVGLFGGSVKQGQQNW